jgi:hypothetical protein
MELGSMDTSTRDPQRRQLFARIIQSDAVDPLANMPAFGEVLSANEMTVISNYLASRK